MSLLIVSYTYDWKIIAFDDLSTVQGMAWGVREDIENGKRGLIPNWCTASQNVCWWEVLEIND